MYAVLNMFVVFRKELAVENDFSFYLQGLLNFHYDTDAS